MNDIKLRAWHTNKHEWWYFVVESTQEDMDHPTTVHLFAGICDGELFKQLKDWGRYTGINDKVGKEIYEGDVILIPRVEKGREFSYEWHVTYGKKAGKVGFNINPVWVHRYKVISNIYGNEELI